MTKNRRKIMQAGRLWMAVQYTAIRANNQSTRREVRAQISTPARESLNARLSWQKLMITMAANFKSTDLHVGLSYRPECRPRRREDADRILSNFIRALRKQRAAAGHLLVYVRVTEGYHGDAQLHHHLIINSTGDDYDVIRALWKKNGDNVDFEPFGADGAERWSKYLTKEPREKGRRHVGDRTWRTSVHMKKPVITYESVRSGEPLQAPPGASVFDRGGSENSYGGFTWVWAWLLNPKLNSDNSDLG